MAPDTMYTVDDFIDGQCYTEKGKLTVCVPLFCRMRRRCTACLHPIVAILYSETFVTFALDPSLISRLITDSRLN